MKQFACMNKIALPPKPMRQQIKVVDVFGIPLAGVHVISDLDKTITDQFGIARINAYPSSSISFSHIGKENVSLMSMDINGEVTLEDAIEELDAVLLENKPKSKNASLWILALVAVGSYMVFKKKKKQPSKKVEL